MKILFYYLAILNLLDGLITHIGLTLSLIKEANPFMNQLYELHPLAFLAFKSMLSFILVLFIFYDKVPNKTWFKSIAVVTAFLYTATLFLHGLWIFSAAATFYS